MAADQPLVPSGTGAPVGARSLPFDTSVAHQARMYDYVLGGNDNYAADRAAVEAWLAADPTQGQTSWTGRR
jgi:hypothetical protein